MGYAQILVQTGADSSAERRVKIAADLANRHKASLVGVYVAPVAAEAFVGAAAEMAFAPGGDRAARVAQHQAKADEDAQRARDAFALQTGDGDAAAEWRALEGEPFAALTKAARLADLSVLAGSRGPTRGVALASVETVVLGAGGPCILVPEVGSDSRVGDRIVVGWDGGREAARALRDALPILKAAQSVTVVIAGHAPAAQDAEMTLAAWFERHGCTGSVTRLPAYEEPPGEVLLRHATRIDADLIVMGFYGHSRLREFILGGMSRHMVHGSPCPLLLSH